MSQEKAFFGYSPAEFAKFRRNAWLYLMLFSVLYCFLYCTRLNLSGAGALMMSDLQWSKSDFGKVTGALFWAYGIGQFINGRMSEVIGPAKFIVLAVALSVAANIILPFTTSLWVIAAIWGLNGFFQSMAWTPGIAILTKWWPGSTRGFAVGFANAFSGFGQVASLLAVALGVQLFPELGWRSAFFVPAVFPAVALVVYLVFSKTSPAEVGLREYVEADRQRESLEVEMRELVAKRGKFYPYKYVLSNRCFQVWLLVAFITGLARYGLVTWVPLYFVGRFDVSITNGLMGSISLPVGMGIGTFVVPWLTDKLCPNNRLPAVVVSSSLAALSILAFLLFDPRIAGEMFAIQVLLFCAGFFIYAINGTAWAYATDIGGRVFSATSSGVLNFFAYMGAAIQSFVYGMIVDKMGWLSVFTSIAVFCLIMAGLGVVGKVVDNKRFC
jgi:sugar phosphate permease